jgi:AcrR family transcriptional regulator
VTQATPSTPRRGRPAAASRADVLALATRGYLRGARVDLQAIAAELGLGRTTIYRWFGSRDALLGEVLVRTAEPLLREARAGAEGVGGVALLDTFDRFNRSAALRVITSGAGNVQPRIVEMITDLIESEVSAGTYEPPVEPATLGYAIVRLAEAFLFNDAAAGMRGDVDRLRDVEAAILGLKLESRRASHD